MKNCAAILVQQSHPEILLSTHWLHRKYEMATELVCEHVLYFLSLSENPKLLVEGMDKVQPKCVKY